MFSFLKKKQQNKEAATTEVRMDKVDEWVKIEPYLEVDSKEYVIPALISASVIVGAQKEANLSLKKISIRNPELVKVSLIASACVTQAEHSNFMIHNIYKKRSDN